MSGFIDDVERDLVDAARRRRDARRAASVARLRQRLGIRRVALATLVVALVGAASAGATLLMLRGSVIPGPATRDVPPDQLPEPGTARVSDLRAPDPERGEPSWTVRLARGSTGLLCTTVGQVVGGRFGLIGLDGRFRVYGARVVDSCGQRLQGERASLIGARVFDADDPAAVRTVVSGVGGEALRSAAVVERGVARPVPVGDGGVFVGVVRGYPEDSGLEVVLRFASGHVERRPFGRSPWVVPDPDGGRAWKVQAMGLAYRGRRPLTCVWFAHARGGFGLGTVPRSPGACGATRAAGPGADDVFFAVRRLAPGVSEPGPGMHMRSDWGRHPPRTAVWGAAGARVARIEIAGPGVARTVEPHVGRVFLALFRPDVDPRALTVRVVFDDGRVETHRGDAGLTVPEAHRR